LLKYFDNSYTKSIAHRFRNKRFLLFKKLFENLLLSQKNISILDVGGTEIFWKNMGIDNYPNKNIILLNLTKELTNHNNIDSITGDACDMKDFKDKKFDIVFSNSVIEHVGDFKKQLDMANEIQRVGQNYFIQTPNCE
jgi:ubiquinone/menaquinone biosynthesis C-methylase UbiE